MTGPYDYEFPASTTSSSSAARLGRWQLVILVTLLVGYAGYYVCRSNFSVVAKPLQAEFGLDKEQLGAIASWGVLFYAIGKFLGGAVCDFIGGRTMFLFGMFGSIVCTVLFATSPELFGASHLATAFLASWCLNRLVQSSGWGALVKVAARWFPVARHGRVMAILCLSYLFGDAVAKLFLGELLRQDFGWRQLYFAAAGVLAVIAAATYVLLRPSPRSLGLPEPEVNPENVFGDRGEESRPESFAELMAPLLASPTFWMVCVVSLGLTFIREAFNFWLPTYLAEATGQSVASAASYSAIFPFVGGVSALAAGRLTDYWIASSRGKVIFPALALLVVALWTLGSVPENAGVTIPLVCVSAVAFLLIGPYTFLTGVMALDFGGKRGSSTAAGLIDSAGYLGSMVSLWLTGRISDRFGWQSVFLLLAAVATLSAVAALVYWLLDEFRRRDLRERMGRTREQVAETALVLQ